MDSKFYQVANLQNRAAIDEEVNSEGHSFGDKAFCFDVEKEFLFKNLRVHANAGPCPASSYPMQLTYLSGHLCKVWLGWPTSVTWQFATDTCPCGLVQPIKWLK